MTPERIKEIRAVLRDPRPVDKDWIIDALLAAVERQSRELVEARLTAEEAWDAVDEKEAA